MTKEEKLAIAWIALDGLLWRKFFTFKQYESRAYRETLKEAFEPYRRFIMGEDQFETDFLMLLHIQNSVERNLQEKDFRYVSMSPLELTTSIANGAAGEILHEKEYFIFTAFRK